LSNTVGGVKLKENQNLAYEEWLRSICFWLMHLRNYSDEWELNPSQDKKKLYINEPFKDIKNNNKTLKLKVEKKENEEVFDIDGNPNLEQKIAFAELISKRARHEGKIIDLSSVRDLEFKFILSCQIELDSKRTGSIKPIIEDFDNSLEIEPKKQQELFDIISAFNIKRNPRPKQQFKGYQIAQTKTAETPEPAPGA